MSFLLHILSFHVSTFGNKYSLPSNCSGAITVTNWINYQHLKLFIISNSGKQNRTI